jgi:hypothetical protein
MNQPKEVVFSEAKPGHYSSTFVYDPEKADRFWASMTLIKSGISSAMMDDDIELRIRHMKGGSVRLRNNQKTFTLQENEEIVVYKGKFRLVDNDSRSTFLSYTSDSEATFEVIIDSKVVSQVVAVRWGYASGG